MERTNGVTGASIYGMASRIERSFQQLQVYVGRPWYPLLLAFLAAADHLVIFIPTDALLISAVIAVPARWIRFFVWLTLGSLAGSAVLGGLVEIYGISIIEWVSPGIQRNEIWSLTLSWMDQHGLWALLLVSALPIFQRPAIALAVLSHLPLPSVFLAILAGRLIKFGTFAWLASHTPHLIRRFAKP